MALPGHREESLQAFKLLASGYAELLASGYDSPLSCPLQVLLQVLLNCKVTCTDDGIANTDTTCGMPNDVQSRFLKYASGLSIPAGMHLHLLCIVPDPRD